MNCPHQSTSIIRSVMECKKTQLHINHMNYYKENPQRFHEEICVHLQISFITTPSLTLCRYFKSMEMEKKKRKTFQLLTTAELLKLVNLQFPEGQDQNPNSETKGQHWTDHPRRNKSYFDFLSIYSNQSTRKSTSYYKCNYFRIIE